MNTKATSKKKKKTLDMFFKKKAIETVSTGDKVDTKPPAKSDAPKRVPK